MAAQLSPASTHLCSLQVYLTLAALVLVAASGVAVQSILHIPPLVCMVRPDDFHAADASESQRLRQLLCPADWLCSMLILSGVHAAQPQEDDKKVCTSQPVSWCSLSSVTAKKEWARRLSQTCTDQAERLMSGSAKACLISCTISWCMPCHVAFQHLLCMCCCRYALAAGTALFQGAAAAPLVQMALALHPGVLVTAFLGTAAVFACFSAAALVSRRRSYLYLTGGCLLPAR